MTHCPHQRDNRTDPQLS